MQNNQPMKNQTKITGKTVSTLMITINPLAELPSSYLVKKSMDYSTPVKFRKAMIAELESRRNIQPEAKIITMFYPQQA
jgi:hypothetical protein